MTIFEVLIDFYDNIFSNMRVFVYFSKPAELKIMGPKSDHSGQHHSYSE